MSEPIGQLAAALAIVQGKMKASAKGRVNPFFKSRYSTLEDVWDCARALLSENGLAVIQTLGNSPEGVSITTILAHKSGESVSGTFTVPVAKRDAQAFGSAATYARRYAFAAMVGVVPDEDDDGNAATGGNGRASVPAAARLSSRLRGEPTPPVHEDIPQDIPIDDAGLPPVAAMRADLVKAAQSGPEVKNAALACGFKGRSLDTLNDAEVARLYETVWPVQSPL